MSTKNSGARHRASTVKRPTIKGMLASASAIAGASVIAVCAAGGTYALWNGEQSIPEASVTSGTTGLTVNGQLTAPIDGLAWSKMLPGDVISQQVTVKNTGNVPGVVTASTTGGGPLVVHLKKNACSGTISGTSSTLSSVTLGTFNASESSIVCVQVTMPANAPAGAQGANQSFTVTFTTTSGS